MQNSLAALDAITLVKRIRQLDASPVEALEDIAAVIESENDRLNAYCTLCLDQAREAARVVEAKLVRGEELGPLAGVPISIKDLIFTKSIRTTGGSNAYRDFVPDEDDVVVERVRAAGAIVLGKTNVSELGYSLTGDNPVFGVTRNPWNDLHTSGGSSAGAAVAVATGMGPIAVGSDGGGSIRVPAAFCGLFGMKPSMGRIPLYPGCRDERFPGFSSWESLEHIGPLSRTVADAALLLTVMTGPDRRDRHSIPQDIRDWSDCLHRDIKGLRVGYCATWAEVAVHSEIAELTNAAAVSLQADLGCIVEPVYPPWSNPLGHFRALMAMDSDLRGMRDLARRCGPNISVNLKKFLEVEWTAEMFTEAVKARKAIANAAAGLFQAFDVLVAPIVAQPAPLADKPTGAIDIDRPLPTFTCVANMLGLPASSVPIGWTTGGLPIGIQIIGAHLEDSTVLAVSAALEKTNPWHRWPRLGREANVTR